MRTLALDYLDPAPRRRLATYALLVIALGLTLDLACRYARLKSELRELEVQVATRKATAGEHRHVTGTSADEYESARSTARRLATPWGELFRALEAAQTERVALTAIAPDVDSRTITISGEARDYLAALSYVANLGQQKSFRAVRLSRHEVRNGPARSVAFTITAAWKEEE